jgi:hypothetical protein
MNVVTRRMWEKGTTLTRWAENNGFCVGYVRHIISGKRGQWGVGKAERIVRALLLDGYLKDVKELKGGE